MSKIRSRKFRNPIGSGIVGVASLCAASGAIAQTTVAQTPVSETQSTDRVSIEEIIDQERVGTVEIPGASDLETLDSLSQVTSISQLSDVQPTDWAFQALQSLVERYGCIAGYPDGTYRGNQATTRYEFAAGLNACLDQILNLVDVEAEVSAEDLAVIRRLQEEFAAELATLRGRVDALESRTAELEANQFSTTTKLEGSVIFAAYGVAAGERDGGQDIDRVTAFGDRVRLELNTSFTGDDLLFTRLQASNISAFDTTGTFQGDLFFADDNGNDIEIDALKYEFPVGEQLTVALVANAGASDDFAPSINPYLDGDGNFGALSRFGTRAPIYYLTEQAGLGLYYELNDKIALSAGYLAADAGNPEDGAGLFNGAYGFLGQITATPFDGLEVGLTYLNAYNLETSTGSNLSNFLSFSEDTFGTEIPNVQNAYGVQLSWQLAEQLVLGGWAGFVDTKTLSTLGGTVNRGGLESWNWAVSLAVPDLGTPGSLAGIIVGMEPRTRGVTPALRDDIVSAGGRIDDVTSLHIEGFYQFQVSDNIAITPGVIVVTDPSFDEDNDTLVIGAIRTLFSF
ncbi:MAG: iron uptake porin [Cyanobacteriota bacterium]|nr:iron uptake porin [Cyanobacteriota bacterium]